MNRLDWHVSDSIVSIKPQISNSYVYTNAPKTAIWQYRLNPNQNRILKPLISPDRSSDTTVGNFNFCPCQTIDWLRVSKSSLGCIYIIYILYTYICVYNGGLCLSFRMCGRGIEAWRASIKLHNSF